MSAKQEPAPAPATVSQGDSGGQRQAPPAAVTTPSQPPPQQPHVSHYQGQVIYQQQPYGTVHYQQPGQQWNQQPPQGTVHFVQYQQQEYPEKVQSYNHYGTVHYAQPINNGDMMMRGPQYVQQPYVSTPQWYQPGQGPPQGQFIPSYANNFNVATDPAYNTQMGRGQRRNDDFQGGQETPYGYMQFVPFVAPIGVMESQAHASASYTANWVSSTSSIPPELRDEPEDFQSDNISQYDGQRPSSQQLNGDNWTERDEHFSPSTAHHHSQPLSSSSTMRHPYNEKTERNGGAGSSGQHENKKPLDKRPVKKEKSDRNDEKRELTFDERLEKARMQKDRVENKRDVPETSPNPGGAQSSSSAPQPVTPRSNGQKPRHEGYNNNQNPAAGNSNSFARGGGGGRNHQVATQQPPQQNNGNNSGNAYPSGNGGTQGDQGFQGPRFNEGDRVPRRDNIYANRYENNHQNPSTNQPLLQQPPRAPQPPPHRNQPHPPLLHGPPHPPGPPPHFPPTNQPPPSSSNMRPPPNQFHPNHPPFNREGGDFYRQPNYRGRGGRGGSFRGNHGPPPNFNQPPYMMPHQMMDPNILATLNAFQNLNFPPGVSRLPLLPGPFGMPRQPPQIQQDIKFRNTWLDASFPLPLGAMMNLDTTRYTRGGAAPRGRGRGGYNGGYRGGYRGQSNGNGYGPSTSSAGTSAKKEVKPDVKAETKEEAKAEVKTEETEEVKENVKEGVQKDVKEVVKDEVKDKVKEDVKEDLKQEEQEEPKEEPKEETVAEEKPKEEPEKPAVQAADEPKEPSETAKPVENKSPSPSEESKTVAETSDEKTES